MISRQNLERYKFIVLAYKDSEFIKTQILSKRPFYFFTINLHNVLYDLLIIRYYICYEYYKQVCTLLKKHTYMYSISVCRFYGPWVKTWPDLTFLIQNSSFTCRLHFRTTTQHVLTTHAKQKVSLYSCSYIVKFAVWGSWHFLTFDPDLCHNSLYGSCFMNAVTSACTFLITSQFIK